MKIIVVLILILGCIKSLTTLPTHNIRHKELQFTLLQSTNHDVNKTCSICKSIVGFLHGFGSAELGVNLLVKFADFICDRYKIETQRVCHSIIPEFKAIVWDVFFDAIVEPNELCGWLFGNTCANTTAYFSSWNITIPKRNNPPKELQPFPDDSAGVQILQLTDTHLDQDYLEGAQAVCDEPLCCRKEDKTAGKGQIPAPKFGYPGYCDSNLLMFHTMLEDIAVNHTDVKYIYWTGDVPAHNVWNQSKQNQKDAINFATVTLTKYFPNTKIFPTIGNHEGFPVNSFPPEYVSGPDSGEWLRSTLAEDWGAWLPADTKDTILKGGFYTTIVEKGLRLISLNMNYGNSGNWWLWIKSADPAGQLQWFADTLLKAEQAGEKVHVIGHIPPDHCMKWFSYNYYSIISRFYDTISGQFFGHTHHDEMRMFYDIETFSKPIGVAYIAPSVTTYHALNPGYRIYTVDGQQGNSTWHVTDVNTYYADLVKAAKIGQLHFEHEYNTKETYGMKGLTPGDWDKTLYKFLDDPELFQKFYKAYYKQYQKARCVGTCLNSYVCTMLNGLGGGFHDFCNFMGPLERRMYMTWRSETYDKC